MSDTGGYTTLYIRPHWCADCRYRSKTSGECTNHKSVKSGDYVLPGASCPRWAGVER